MVYYKIQQLIDTKGYRNEWELKGRAKKYYDEAKKAGILDLLDYSEK